MKIIFWLVIFSIVSICAKDIIMDDGRILSIAKNGELEVRSIRAKIIKKSSPIKTDKVSIAGITIGEMLNPEVQLLMYSAEYNNYSKTLSSEYYPYDSLEIHVVPSTNKVHTIYIGLNKVLNFHNCVSEKNVLLDKMFFRYGGKYSNKPLEESTLAKDGSNVVMDMSMSKGVLVINNVNIEMDCVRDITASNNANERYFFTIRNQKLYEQAQKEMETENMAVKESTINKLLQ